MPTASAFTVASKPASIQVIPTQHVPENTGPHSGFVEPQFDGSDESTTHWSVYTRDDEGFCRFDKDFEIVGGDGAKARADACAYAGQLAAELNAFIENVPV